MLHSLRVCCSLPQDNPLAVHRLAFAECVVLVLPTIDEVLRVRANRLPPTFHVFCNSITEGVRPEDFFPAGPRASVVITSGLGIAGLRAFNETLPLPCTNASVAMDAKSGAFDLSFMTGIRRLESFTQRTCRSRSQPASSASNSTACVWPSRGRRTSRTLTSRTSAQPSARVRGSGSWNGLGRYSPRRRFASATWRPSSG